MYKSVIQTIARRFLKLHNIHPPLDLNYVARVLSATIYYQKMPLKVDAVTMPLKDGTFVIFVNISHSENRIRFTIAHELGHIALGHCNYGASLFSLSNRSNTIEREADIFASELLMPSIHVKHLVFGCGWKDIDELSKLYGVSRQAMEIKMEEIGALEGVR